MNDQVQPDNPAIAWNAAILTAADGMQACWAAWAGWQSEVARFVDKRAGENGRAWSALLASKDPAAVLRVQQEWGLQAATDYAEEATRLAKLATSLALTGTTPAVQRSTTLVA